MTQKTPKFTAVFSDGTAWTAENVFTSARDHWVEVADEDENLVAYIPFYNVKMFLEDNNVDAE